MPDRLLNLLTLFLLLLLYLFFFRVLRAVWAEISPMKAPEPAQRGLASKRAAPRRPRRRRGSQPQLRVVAPEGLRGSSFALSDELTVGRAAGCQITLDDAYASQLHARVFRRDGRWYVEDLGSTNGTYLNRRKVSGPMVLERGDHLQIGNTVMELA